MKTTPTPEQIRQARQHAATVAWAIRASYRHLGDTPPELDKIGMKHCSRKSRYGRHREMIDLNQWTPQAALAVRAVADRLWQAKLAGPGRQKAIRQAVAAKWTAWAFFKLFYLPRPPVPPGRREPAYSNRMFRHVKPLNSQPALASRAKLG